MPPEEILIIIDDDGTVVFTHLTRDMAEVAGKLGASTTSTVNDKR